MYKMENWSQYYGIVYKRFCELFLSSGEKPSQLAFARFLGISQGKIRSWQAGQWPLAPDLALLADKLKLNPSWLLTGEGNPDAQGETAVLSPPGTARNAAGQLVGHLLHDIIEGELRLTLDQFATATGIEKESLDQLIAGRRYPTWAELDIMDRAFGVSPHFLLTGQGHDTLPTDCLTRLARATGLQPEAFSLNAGLGVPVEDAAHEVRTLEQYRARRVEWLMEHPGDTENAPLPPPLPEVWRREALARFCVASDWLAGVETMPSHARAQDPALLRLDGLIARLKAHGGTDEQIQDMILASVAGEQDRQRDKIQSSEPAKTARLSGS